MIELCDPCDGCGISITLDKLHKQLNVVLMQVMYKSAYGEFDKPYQIRLASDFQYIMDQLYELDQLFFVSVIHTVPNFNRFEEMYQRVKDLHNKFVESHKYDD